MISRITISAVTALLLLLASCGGSSAEGTYTVDVDKTLAPLMEKVPEAARKQMSDAMKTAFEKTSMTLNVDNTFTGESEMAMGGETKKSTMKGTWSMEGDMITLKTTHEDGAEKPSTKTGKLDGGVIALEEEGMGQKMTVYFKKK